MLKVCREVLGTHHLSWHPPEGGVKRRVVIRKTIHKTTFCHVGHNTWNFPWTIGIKKSIIPSGMMMMTMMMLTLMIMMNICWNCSWKLTASLRNLLNQCLGEISQVFYLKEMKIKPFDHRRNLLKSVKGLNKIWNYCTKVQSYTFSS